MPEIFLGLIFIALLFGFAIYGFGKFLQELSRPKMQNPDALPDINLRRSRFDLDVQGAGKILNYLRIRNRVDQSTYEKLRDVLEEEFSEHHELCNRIGNEQSVTESATTSTEHPARRPDGDTIVEAELLQSTTVANDADADSQVKVSPEPQTNVPDAPLDPWDQPAPPSVAPRRSFAELMSGFMLKRNIRWGELASGILIVGSAVGLVTSLRNELRDTIPYFSALLFLLITAAIHAAGIYTLKKWKLRNTSRGTLIIGLLLVPLNLIAACILSGNENDRRELSDPLLWTAIIIGLMSFATMTWFSSRFLLRKGQLPLVIGIMGCCAMTLIINRAPDADGISFNRFLYTIPLGGFFLAGTALFYHRQWMRADWPSRLSRRMFLCLGLTSFAVLVSMAMLTIKMGSKQAAIVALTPLLSLMFVMTSWLGRMVWKGGRGSEQKSLRLTGLTLHILGLGMLFVSVAISISNPAMLLLNTAVASVTLFLFARHQNEFRLLPMAWLALGISTSTLVNLWFGKLAWDTWAGFSELVSAVFSGQSALSLLFVGLVATIVHFATAQNSKSQSYGHRQRSCRDRRRMFACRDRQPLESEQFVRRDDCDFDVRYFCTACHFQLHRHRKGTVRHVFDFGANGFANPSRSRTSLVASSPSWFRPVDRTGSRISLEP